ncbi:hypothetical protein ACWESM_18760 [Nocardia sp. NPDC003999]
MSTLVEPGQIWRDSRARYLRVDQVVDGRAAMVVIAQQIGERVTAPMRGVSMQVDKVAVRMALVGAAPEPTGPDVDEVRIDHARQTLELVIGERAVRVPYFVGSSGPRVRLPEGGTSTRALVTFTVDAGAVRETFGGER